MATLTAKDVGHVEKLSGTNFPFWKFQISFVLRQHGLMDIVLGKEACPDPVIENNIVKNAAEIQSWSQKDVSASNSILATLETRCQRTLLNCKTASEIWCRLTNQYEQATQENKYLHQRMFFDYQYQPEHDVMSHISAVEALANRLNDLGCPVNEVQLITKITMTLPPSFDSLVDAWENLDDDKKYMQIY
jgi:hypothetical protein